ncbi:MAG: Ig-like domain repeat protein [Acidobacteriaceae bacterium]|nr:Ig-like domain repeat protein [Acidobacteriaceae bacterium]
MPLSSRKLTAKSYVLKALCLLGLSFATANAVQAQSATAFPTTTAVGTTSAALTVTIPLTVSGIGPGAVASTQGATTSDFTAVPGTGSCALGVYLAGGSCTTNVTFKPLYPGLRVGVVEVLSSDGQVLGQALVSGMATGSLAVLKPGRIDTVVGSGDWIYRGDNVVATLAQIFLPMGIVSDAAGNLYISDSNNNRVRKVNATTNMIITVAGNGTPGYSGDNGLATSASISSPSGIVLDGAGDIFFEDSVNMCVRRVDAVSGIITTVAGTCGVQGYSGDGAAATKATLSLPEGLAMGTDGSLYISDTGNNVVRKVAAGTGVITTIAGTSVSGYSGDGGKATAAQLASPWGIALGSDGSLYVADLTNNRIRKIDPSGVITTVAGNGNRTFDGDGGSGPAAALNAPAGVALDPAGNIYIGDSGNNRVREISVATGLINTIVGTDSESFGGDGGAANVASLYGPYALWIDQTGQLFIADMFHNRIRRVTAAAVPLIYDTIRVGKTSAPQAVGLENDGNATLNVSGFAFDQSAIDSATTTCAVGTLAIGVQCNLGVEFAPTTVGDTVTGTLTVNSDAGNTPAIVTLTGDVLTVNPTAITVATSGTPSMFGASVTFTASITTDATTALTGTIDFKDGTTTICQAVTVANNGAACSTSQLALGTHSITAVYSGDNENAAATSPALQQVVKQQATVALTVSPSPGVVTQSVSMSATVTAASGTASGTVTFNSDGSAVGSATLASGIASINISTLTVGTHTITAVYSGDTTNASATSPQVSEVIALASTATTESSDKTELPVGSTVTFGATVTGTATTAPTGTVQFLDGANSIGSGTLSSSKTSFATSALTPGTHSIKASYTGDTNNDVSMSAPISVVVDQIPTATTLVSDSTPANAAAIVTFTATVTATTSATGAGTLTGTVTFMDGGTTLGTAQLDANGKATFQSSTLSVATHSITAKFGGNTNYSASTSTAVSEVVNKTATTTTLSVTSTGLAGKSVALSAQVTSATGIPTGTVTFSDGATTLGTGTVSATGAATFSTTTLGVGNHSITASYGGDTNYNSSISSSSPEVIALATPTLTLSGPTGSVNAGVAATFTSVIASTGVTPTGTITLLDAGASVSTQTVAATNNFSLSTLAVGPHSLTVSYGGDGNNAKAVSNAVAVTITQGSTATSLTTSKTPQTLGSSVTFSAVVTSPSPNITGTVSFYDGGTLLGSPAVDSTTGAASLATSALTFGGHTITAKYSGDSNHTLSSSVALQQQIVQPTTSVITSSLNPAVSGASVTFTAHLSGAISTAPSGAVTFLDGATTLGAGTLDASGTATFTTTALAVGPHSISISYAGDTNYATTTSSVLTQTITNADTQVLLTASANPATYGAPVVLTAAITSNGGLATGKVNFVEGSTILGTAVLDGTGVGTLSISTLAPGTHTISANYLGDGKAAASASTPLTLVVRQATSVTLTSNANPALTLSSITFTATVANAGQDVAAGVVTFTDGSTTLGSATLDGTGNAVLTLPLLAAGSHAVIATYAGNGTNFAATSPTITQVVNLRATSTTLTATTDPNNSQQVTLIAVVRYTGPSVPTGSMTFMNGSNDRGYGDGR